MLFDAGASCEQLDRDSLRRLGDAICIAYERIIPSGNTARNICVRGVGRCTRLVRPSSDSSTEGSSYIIQFNTFLAEQCLLQELQKFLSSTNWEVFEDLLKRQAGTELATILEGVRVVDIGLNSLEAGTEDGLLEDQRKQSNEPSFVVELGMSLLATPDDTFQTGKILAPNIKFLARVSAAMSKAMDDKDIDDFTVLRMKEESLESRTLMGSGGEKVILHVLVDCSTPEEAQKRETMLQNLPRSEVQRAFQEIIEGIELVEVLGVDSLYESPGSETTSSDSSSYSLHRSQSLRYLEFIATCISTLLVSATFK